MSAARQAISSPLLESAIDGARGILLNICGGSDLTLFEVNEAATVIHEVAHAEANIIFGTTIDDEMGDEVRVTVIAAGFDRWDRPSTGRAGRVAPDDRSPSALVRDLLSQSHGAASEPPRRDLFADADDDDLGGDDDFDVPSFLK